MINITKTLYRGKLIKLGVENTLVELRYEKLPYVCYYCSMLEHNERTWVVRKKDIQ